MIWRALTTTVLALALASCSCIALVRVSGSLSDGVRLEVVHPQTGKAIRSTILEVYVYEVGAGAGSVPVWHATGKATLPSITYGQLPQGMKAIVPARALDPGKVYSFGASFDSRCFLGPPSCLGGLAFKVDPDGIVQSCSGTESTCR